MERKGDNDASGDTSNCFANAHDRTTDLVIGNIGRKDHDGTVRYAKIVIQLHHQHHREEIHDGKAGREEKHNLSISQQHENYGSG